MPADNSPAEIVVSPAPLLFNEMVFKVCPFTLLIVNEE